MRIAVLGSAAALHTWRWSRALGERGFEVRLFSLESPSGDVPLDGRASSSVSFVELPSSALPGVLRYPLAAPVVARLLSAFDPHLVDAHFVPNYGLMGALAKRRPLTVNCWGSDLLTARDPLRRARARWVLARADRVFVDAEVLGRAARSLGVPDERLSVVPWGIELERFPFSPDAASRRAARASWPASWLGPSPVEAPVVVSTRVLHPIYDVDTLVRAWPTVARRHPGARCLVAGDGPLREALVRRAGALGVSESLRFLGRLASQELARLLAGADVYVSTSRSDSTSISLLEAMGAGAFPVVTDIAGNREWMSEESAGWFAAGDDEMLAQRLLDALGDTQACTTARAVNRRVIEERGARGRAMDRVASELRQLAERGAPARPA